MDPKEHEQVDPFDFAFDEALNGMLGEGEAATDEQKTDEQKTDEQKTDEQKTDEQKTDEQKTDEQKTDEQKTEEQPTVDPRDEEIARLKAKLAEKPKTEEPEDDPKARARQEAETKAAEEANKKAQEEWESFKQDWAEPAAMMEKMYGAIMSSVQSIVEQALAHYHEKMVSPLVENSNLSANDRLLMQIREKHQDGPDLVSSGAVDTWIQTLPTWQQEAANKVLDSGSAEDVIALLDVYKQTTGQGKQETKPKVDPEAEEEKQRKLRAMTAVNDRRTTSTSEPDPNDFDGAFKQAIAGG